MITALLVPAVVAGFLVQVDDEAVALAKARAFRDMAATANGTYSNLYVPVFELESADHTPDVYVFAFPDGRVRLRRSDHLIVGFSYSPPDRVFPPPESWDHQNAIGDNLAMALGTEYVAASGCTQPVVVKQFVRELNANGFPAYVLAYLPTHESIFFHPEHRIAALIDYNTGRLTGLTRDPRLPNPPTSFQVSISLEAAIYNFAAHVYTNFGASTLNVEVAELVIWNPKPQHINQNVNAVPQSVLDLIGTNESTLAYCFSAFQPSMGESVKTDVAAFGGYVDPNSGTVWSVKKYSPFGGGKAAPLRWDLGIGAITVSNGRQSVEVKDADVDQASAPKKFTPTAKLVLRRAKVVVMIEYDRSSGLIRTTLGEAHSYGKPSPNLKKALDKLTN